jgi:hypothetical protein
MTGKVNDGQLCTVQPLGDHVPAVGDIVLCRVKGNQYLHSSRRSSASDSRSATTEAASTAGSRNSHTMKMALQNVRYELVFESGAVAMLVGFQRAPCVCSRRPQPVDRERYTRGLPRLAAWTGFDLSLHLHVGSFLGCYSLAVVLQRSRQQVGPRNREAVSYGASLSRDTRQDETTHALGSHLEARLRRRLGRSGTLTVEGAAALQHAAGSGADAHDVLAA